MRIDQIERYKRHLMLGEVGEQGQERLLAARVLLVGTGGLGSPAALYLAAAGVGTLGLIEFDTVDRSNLQRQILYSNDDVGRSKLEAASERLRALNPDVNLELHAARLTAENAREVIADYELVVDGTDTFPSRYLTNDVCTWLSIPLVYGSVMRFEGQVSVFHASRGPCYRCLFPQPPPPELAPNCAEAGVLGVLPGVIGMLQATEAIKLILGIGDSLEGRLLMYDALSMEFRSFRLEKDPKCPVCGPEATIFEPIDYEAFCSATEAGGMQAEAVSEISAQDLARLRARGAPHLLLDVREPFERELAHIAGSMLIPLGELSERLSELENWRDSPIVVHCKSGARSLRACRLLLQYGFRRVENLQGGIDRWSLDVTGDIPQK